MFRVFWAFLALAQAQKVFEVPEGAPIGTLIGSIGTPGPYLIVPIDQVNNPEEDLAYSMIYSLLFLFYLYLSQF